MISPAHLKDTVSLALAEDIGSGDITAKLVKPDATASARVISRESGVLCGQAFVNAVFHQLDPAITVVWFKNDGEAVNADELLFAVDGNARAILTGERTALNFLQLRYSRI